MNYAYEYLLNKLDANSIVVVGCSGGPDSMAVMDLLVKLRKNKFINIVCAHVNHNVRKASKKEAEFVSNYCQKNKIYFEMMTIQNYGDDNFHNEARTIRYNFFDSIVKKYSANYLITAHHGDDLIETILMRIVRGSSVKGYSGFAQEVKKDNYMIIRPLIYTTKEEILMYNYKNSVKFVVDKSNFKTKYTRNRYRKYILPFLKKEDIHVHQKFLKFSNELLQYVDYVNLEVEEQKNNCYCDEKINIKSFLKLNPLIKKQLLYTILEDIYQDDLFLITDVHVNMILDLINQSKTNGYLYLPNEVKVLKSYNELYIGKNIKDIPSYDIELGDYAKLPNGKEIIVIKDSDVNNNDYCRLNFEDVSMPLHVRTRKNGDKIAVKGMNGHQKVKDIFIDKKIPMNDRDSWPIVIDSKGNIVWIPGIKKSKYDVSKNKKCDIILKYY